jgi:hypothetical protein
MGAAVAIERISFEAVVGPATRRRVRPRRIEVSSDTAKEACSRGQGTSERAPMSARTCPRLVVWKTKVATLAWRIPSPRARPSVPPRRTPAVWRGIVLGESSEGFVTLLMISSARVIDICKVQVQPGPKSSELQAVFVVRCELSLAVVGSAFPRGSQASPAFLRNRLHWRRRQPQIGQGERRILYAHHRVSKPKRLRKRNLAGRNNHTRPRRRFRGRIRFDCRLGFHYPSLTL